MDKKIVSEVNPIKINVKMDNNDFRALLKKTRGELKPALSHNEECKTNNDEESRKVKAARAEGHKKKKENYIKMKQLYENSLLELSQKYRDRAQERRDRTNNEPSLNDELIKTSGYHAVAPDIKSGINAQEIRHKLIEESKYLGGDLEHTHLVKGLDYALLQKVREEIKLKEEDKGDINSVNTQVSEKGKEKSEVICKSYLANQIYKNAFPSKDVKMNPLFVPGRMAYVMDLLDDGMDTDIPTVLIRSKSEIPNNQATTLTSVNDIVINKLTQILSYLRQGSINVKKSKKKNDKYIDHIFDEEYLCPPKNINTRTEQNKQTKEKTHTRKEMKSRETQIGTITCRKSTKHDLFSRLTAAPTGYAECYPGQDEMNDAIEDSDDEIDYTKMDLGCQKGSVGRWDFDSQEEYNQYLNNKEALPKAAFQYGLKMNDGRRTRKYNKKNEKGEINQEWNTIRSMIMKRKENPSGHMIMDEIFSFLCQQKIKALIETADSKHSTSINLSRLDAVHIPLTLFNLDHLLKIYLHKNKLDVLPVEIIQLKNLHTLTLDYNNLRSLPSPLGAFKHLTYLNLSYNPLVNLTSEIGDLTTLKALWLNCTELQILPGELSKLKSLETLGARGNYIKEFPSDLCNLNKLSWLTLDSNSIQRLPSDFKLLSNLVHLNVNNNCLIRFPECLTFMKKLKFVYLSYNKISTINEDGLHQLTKLKQLHLQNNPLEFAVDRKLFPFVFLRDEDLPCDGTYSDSDSEEWEGSVGTIY